MHKPESQIDAIEEVENILIRLVPASMSESATRANDAMIENLAGKQSAGNGVIASGHAWWKVGIAASILLAAGLPFMTLTNSAVAGDLQYVGSNCSTRATSEGQFIEGPDGQSQVAVEYSEEDADVYLDRKSGIKIEVVEYHSGHIVACNQGIF